VAGGRCRRSRQWAKFQPKAQCQKVQKVPRSCPLQDQGVPLHSPQTRHYVSDSRRWNCGARSGSGDNIRGSDVTRTSTQPGSITWHEPPPQPAGFTQLVGSAGGAPQGQNIRSKRRFSGGHSHKDDKQGHGPYFGRPDQGGAWCKWASACRCVVMPSQRASSFWATISPKKDAKDVSILNSCEGGTRPQESPQAFISSKVAAQVSTLLDAETKNIH
jgi:hypothetical protein